MFSAYDIQFLLRHSSAIEYLKVLMLALFYRHEYGDYKSTWIHVIKNLKILEKQHRMIFIEGSVIMACINPYVPKFVSFSSWK